MNRRSIVSSLLFVIGVASALAWRFASVPPSAARVRRDASAPATRRSTLVMPPSRQTIEGGLVRREVVLMGSSFVFVVDAPPEKATPAIDATIERLRRLEFQISSWRPGSDITKLNGRAGRTPVSVAPDTFELLRLAKQLHRETDGALDVTIGPVWDLWPFRDPQRALPSRREIDEARNYVDASKIELDESRHTAFLPLPGMRVNLGAIGKGYAAKLAAEELRQHGILRAAISAGGDLFLLGRKTTGPWIVEIEHPRGGMRPLARFMASDIAVATSGNSKRFVVRDGRRFGHILDPRTGYPVAECESVTIITRDPAVADAYATAVFVMGPVEGLAWIEKQPGVEGLIVDAGGNVIRSRGWSRVTGSAPLPAEHQDRRHSATAANATARQPRRTTRTTPPMPAPRPFGNSAGATSPEETTADMVEVPAGECLLGEQRSTETLPAFRIDRAEVTNRQYRKFLEACRQNPHQFCHPEEPPDKDHTPRYWREFRPPLFRQSVAAKLAPFDEQTFRQDDHPVVGIDWWDAYAYAHWAGKRLPTRHEWERAARGTDGRLWPWGNDWERKLANGGGEKWGERDGVLYTAPADSFPQGASPTGCLNMAGNVAEWTEEGMVMGGSFRSNPSQMTCFAGRWRQPEFRSFCVGFRCAADPKKTPKQPASDASKKPKTASPTESHKGKKKDQAEQATPAHKSGDDS